MANVSQENEKKNRYVVEISFYMYADNDKECISNALKHCHELNKLEDCRATVDKITESKFGKNQTRKVY